MTIFLSTPISCFDNPEELIAYKKSINQLINGLKEKYYVYSEIEKIYNESDYDTPEKSIEIDLQLIKKSEVFIFHYPKAVPTSALIELGVAISLKKVIIIISPSLKMLPYLALGINSICPKSFFIETTRIDHAVIEEIIKKLK